MKKRNSTKNFKIFELAQRKLSFGHHTLRNRQDLERACHQPSFPQWNRT